MANEPLVCPLRGISDSGNSRLCILERCALYRLPSEFAVAGCAITKIAESLYNIDVNTA
jgi:hypothetical protein